MLECVRAAYAKYVESIGKEPAPMLVDYRGRILERVVYVAEEARAGIVGVLVAVPQSDAIFIENVAVHPARQGAGVGRRLMRLAEDLAYEHGLHRLRLYTNEAMHENVSYYCKLGFKETDRRLEGGYRRVFMSKKL